MKKILSFLALAALLCGCGTTKRVVYYNDGDEPIDIGYGTVDKDKTTTAVSKLKVDQDKMTYNNVDDYIRGRVPGVMVTDDNHIIIRGANTTGLYGGAGANDPLVLVDGVEVPVDGLGHISPYDISDITVIKDGSSAIYGFRGANWVILIATKKGGQSR